MKARAFCRIEARFNTTKEATKGGSAFCRVETKKANKGWRKRENIVAVSFGKAHTYVPLL